MNAPFGISFLRKAELYNLCVRFDKQNKEMEVKNPKAQSLWPIEKALLKWTYFGHRHLGSPIKTEHLFLGSSDNKLEEFNMLDGSGKLKKDFIYLKSGNLTMPLENIVVKGFGDYFDERNHGHNAIVINKEGLLLGEVLTEVESENIIVNINYFMYGMIMSHPGAFILLLVTIFTLLKTLLCY